MGDSYKFGQGAAFKLKWIKKAGKGVVRTVENVEDTTQKLLLDILKTGTLVEAKTLNELKKRTLIEKQWVNLYRLVSCTKKERCLL